MARKKGTAARHNTITADDPVQVLMDRLRATHLPDTQETRIHKGVPKSSGRTTGMGIYAYWALLFEANELSSKSKMTDSTILEMVHREFPNRKSLRNVGYGKGKLTPNYFRQRYNNGDLTGYVPTILSRRYDSDGNIVDSKTGRPYLQKKERCDSGSCEYILLDNPKQGWKFQCIVCGVKSR